MDQHGENERLTVVEIIEVKQGFVLRMQDPPEFMQPMGPVVMEDVIQVNPHTLENLSMRLDRLIHLPGAALEDYRECSRALYDQLFGSVSAETRVKLANLNTPLLISARHFETVWELLHDGEEFWGIKYPMARQIRTGVRPPLLPAREFPQRCLIIANPEGEEMLEVSERQAQGLVSHLSSLGIESVYLGRNRATPEQVLIELSSGNYDILHYTGHVVKLDEKNQPVFADQPGEYAMLLAGGYLRQFEVENAARGIGVIFLNGCQSAGSIENLAAAFLHKGANLVIGSVFKVSAYGAQIFAEHFYDRVLGGEPVGEALRQARIKTREDSQCGNAWACFVMYGNPCCRVIGATLPAELQRDYEESARRIVENCVRYAESTGFICTPFLFAAMLNGEDSLLREGLQVQGIATEILQDMFDKALPGDKHGVKNAQALEVSPTVVRILDIARTLAGDENRKGISEKDILQGFILQGGGAIGKLLVEYGANLAEIIDDRQSDLMAQWGLTREKYSTDSRKIVDRIADIVRDLHHSVAGTPHLFMALLEYPPPEMDAFLQQQHITLNSLQSFFISTLQMPAKPNFARKSISLSPNLTEVFHSLEHNQARGTVTPSHILRALAVQSEGKAGKILRDCFGLDIRMIYSDLFKSNGDLNKAKFDFSARKILSAAQTICGHMGYEFIATPHLFLGFCFHGNGLAISILEEQDLAVDVVAAAVEQGFTKSHQTTGCEQALNLNLVTQRLQSILFKAEYLAQETGGLIDERCLLKAFLLNGGETLRVLRGAGVDVENMIKRLNSLPSSGHSLAH